MVLKAFFRKTFVNVRYLPIIVVNFGCFLLLLEKMCGRQDMYVNSILGFLGPFKSPSGNNCLFFLFF